jgi:hypothetical protein
VRLLATALAGNDGTLTRVDERTLELSLRRGFVVDPLSQLPRGPTQPFAKGDVANLAGMTAEVEDITEDRRPARVRFELDRSLEDPLLGWVIWEGDRFVPMVPPPLGREVAVHGIDYARALVGKGTLY